MVAWLGFLTHRPDRMLIDKAVYDGKDLRAMNNDDDDFCNVINIIKVLMIIHD